MVSRQLNRLCREIDRAWESDRRTVGWDDEVLRGLNDGLCELLSEMAGQLEAWKTELDARRELQQRILSAPPTPDRIRMLWWREQRTFYKDLVERMERYLTRDTAATVTFSPTALEVLLLVRLLIEEGVIQTATLQPIFRYLSRYGQTDRQEKLSYESLKKRYSLRHEGARKKVKQLLMNLVKRVDQPPSKGGGCALAE